MHVKASPLVTQADNLKERLLSLEAEERRYTKAYGLDVLPEQLYKDNMKEAELADTPRLSVEQLVEGLKETLRSLDLTDKKDIIRKIVTKVVATQKEATIWGRIPILATEQVGLHANNRHNEFLTQLPFELKLAMPPTDRGKRGYSDKLVANAVKELLTM